MREEKKNEHSIEEEMEWRFVDELGRVELDSDMLAQNITVRELRFIRACIMHAISGQKRGGR